MWRLTQLTLTLSFSPQSLVVPLPWILLTLTPCSSPPDRSRPLWLSKKVSSLDGSGKILEKHLPARLDPTALNATYVTFVDSVTGLPLMDKHVIIKVDQTTDEIAEIVVEDI